MYKKNDIYLFSDIKTEILAYELAKLFIKDNKDKNKRVEVLHETVHNIIKLIEKREK